MKSKFEIRRLGLFPHIGDLLMFPIMWAFVSFKGLPQRTHLWNIRNFSPGERNRIDRRMTAVFPGNPKAQERGKIRAHLPIWLGGWDGYAVVSPGNRNQKWYVGWMASDDFAGMSLIPSYGPVRVLIGPDPVAFFALNEQGQQIQIHTLGSGNISKLGKFSWLPLR